MDSKLRHNIFFALALALLLIGSASASGNLSINSTLVAPSAPILNLATTHYNSYGQAIAACAIGCGNVVVVNQTVVYGSVPDVKAGNSIYYASTKINNTRFIYNVSVEKNPSSVCINLTSSLVSENICSAGVYHLPVAIINGRFGLNGSASIQITAQISSTLIGSQTTSYNAKIQVGGNTLYSTSGQVGSSLSDIRTFTYYPNEALNITIDDTGNANYTAEDPTVNPPVNVVEYIPITIVNTQNSAPSANFVEELGWTSSNTLIGWNAVAYQQYEIPNLTNHEYFLANGVILNSWLEGNYFNEMAANGISTAFSSPNALAASANILEWVELPNDPNFLTSNSGGSPTNIIYMGLSNNGVNAGNVLFNPTTTGEAAQLSCQNPLSTSKCPYGLFDNGQKVFEFYSNFSGTTLPSLWTQSGSSLETATTNNGLIITNSGAGASNLGIVTVNTVANSIISSWLISSHSITGGSPSLKLGQALTNSYCSSTGSYQSEWSVNDQTPAGHYVLEQNIGCSASTVAQITTSGKPQINQILWFPNPETEQIQQYPALNTYTSLSTNIVLTGPLYLAIGESGGAQSVTANIVWARATIIPPGNVFPYTVFGTPTTVGSCSATIGSPSNAVVDVGQYESLTGTEVGCTANYVYTIATSNSVAPFKQTNTITSSSISATSFTATFAMTSNDVANSAEQGNAVVASGSPTVYSSYSSTWTINNAISTPTIAPSSAGTADVGENIPYNAYATGGSGSLTYNFIVYNSVTLIQVGNYLTTANNFLYNVQAGEVGNTLVVKAFVTDHASTPVTVNSVFSGVLTVDSQLVASAPTPTTANIDNGQSITLTATPSGGTPSYSYQWYTDTTNNCLSLSIIGGATSSTYVASPASSTYYCYIVTDSASPIPGVATSSAPANIMVNPTLSVPTILPSGTAKYDIGQSFPVNAYATGGSGSLTYNFIFYNSITLTQLANELITSNNFIITPLATIANNGIVGNVFVTDQAFSPLTKNSPLTGLQIINPALSPQVTASNTPSASPLQYETITVTYGGTSSYTVNIIGQNTVTGVTMTNDLVSSVTAQTTTYTFQIPTAWIGNTINFYAIVKDSATTPVTVQTSNTPTITISNSAAPTLTLPSNYMVYNSLFTLQGNGNPSSDPVSIYMTLTGQPQGSALVSGTGTQSYALCSGTNYCPQIGSYTVNVVDTSSSRSTTGNVLVYVPIILTNTIASTNVLSYSGYGACTNNFAGGNCIGSVTYTSSTVLSNNLAVVGSVTINPGITLTANGFAIILTGNFYNLGTVTGGSDPDAGGSGGGLSLLQSYGGSGAGGGAFGDSGGSTLVAGGLGGSSGSSSGGNGALPSPPILTNNLITIWYQSPKVGNFISGAGGGSGGNSGGSAGTGAAGSYGVLIQANQITAGTITASGSNGGSGSGDGGGGGGGGGGLIVLVYNSIYKAGSYTYGGGSGGSAGGGGGFTGGGGTGGNGNIMVYQYITAPIPLPILNTYYPYLISASEKSSIINYSITQTVNSVTTQPIAKESNLSYQPPANQPTGIYSYVFGEIEGGITYVDIYLNLSANMTDIHSALSFNTPTIQYFPNFVNTPTFTVTPNSWYIQSDYAGNQYSNTISGDQWSNANQIFSPSIVLTYNGFASFTANLINNPAVQTSVTQNAFILYNSNTLPANNIYTREFFNSTTYDLQFFFNWGSTKSDTEQILFNNYTLLPSNTYSTSYVPGNNVKTYIATSNYQNPNAVVQNYTTVVTALGYTGQTINNYCPFTLSQSQWANAFSYLPNLNATSISMSVYLANGQPATNYTLVVQSYSPAYSVLSLKLLSPTSFTINLEQNTQYRFLLYNTLCQLVYTGSYTKPTSPVTIQLPSTIPQVPYLAGNISTISHSCVNTPLVNNVMQTACTFANTATPANVLYMQLQTKSAPYGTVICANTIVAVSGTLYCFSPEIEDTKYSWGLLTNFNNGDGWLDIQVGQFGDPNQSFGNDAAFIALAACIILALLFIRYDIAISIVLVGIGLEAFGVIGLINYGTIQAGTLGGGGLIIFLGVGFGILTRGRG